MKVAKQIRPIDVITSAKWITLAEALVYMCIRSRTTLLNLVRSGKIYGTKPEGGGEYIIDRESIDRYYNAKRDDAEIHLRNLRKAG